MNKVSVHGMEYRVAHSFLSIMHSVNVFFSASSSSPTPAPAPTPASGASSLSTSKSASLSISAPKHAPSSLLRRQTRLVDHAFNKMSYATNKKHLKSTYLEVETSEMELKLAHLRRIMEKEKERRATHEMQKKKQKMFGEKEENFQGTYIKRVKERAKQGQMTVEEAKKEAKKYYQKAVYEPPMVKKGEKNNENGLHIIQTVQKSIHKTDDKNEEQEEKIHANSANLLDGPQIDESENRRQFEEARQAFLATLQATTNEPHGTKKETDVEITPKMQSSSIAKANTLASAHSATVEPAIRPPKSCYQCYCLFEAKNGVESDTKFFCSTDCHNSYLQSTAKVVCSIPACGRLTEPIGNRICRRCAEEHELIQLRIQLERQKLKADEIAASEALEEQVTYAGTNEDFKFMDHGIGCDAERSIVFDSQRMIETPDSAFQDDQSKADATDAPCEASFAPLTNDLDIMHLPIVQSETPVMTEPLIEFPDDD